jgi:GntR family transcriptional regulator
MQTSASRYDRDMEPQVTPTDQPMYMQIADDIRIKIEKGEYKPGDRLPSVRELRKIWGGSEEPPRRALEILKAQGLITTGRGGPAIVRNPPRQVIRDSSRHQAEKDLALADEETRRQHGEAEDDLGLPLSEVEPRAVYSRMPATEELAKIFDCQPGEMLLRKEYEKHDKSGRPRLSYSVSYVPVRLIEGNPALLDQNEEPWPGGHMHQFLTVRIEIGKVVDQVRAEMPTTAEAYDWELSEGVPMFLVRRISVDTDNRVVEVSDARYPADRTILQSTTLLKPWSA